MTGVGDVVERAVAAWDRDGSAVLRGYLTTAELAPAVRGLGPLPPDGVVAFPFADVALSLLAVHPRLVALAAALLREDDLRLVRAEVREATAGGARPLRPEDHTPLVPSDDPRFRQLALVVYLTDVSPGDGPVLVPEPGHTAGAGADGPLDSLGRPVAAVTATAGSVVGRTAPGPAGTVVAHDIGTPAALTPVTAPGATRRTLHVGLRPAAAEWGVGQGWAGVSQDPAWMHFVHGATHHQLALVGFPPPGHPYWAHGTLRAMAERYPCLDLTRWAHRLADGRAGDVNGG